MIIDCHNHIFPPEVIAQREQYLARDRWFGLLYENPKAGLATADDLVAEMDASGVQMAVAFGFGWADMGLCRAANDYVLEACRRHPGRIVGFACVQPRAVREAVREAKRCWAAGLRGVGELMPNGQGFSLDDLELLNPLAAALVGAAAPLMVHSSEPVGHIYRGKGTVLPQTLYRLAAHYPELTLICSHWGGGLPFYELMPEVRQTLASVYYDTAASLLLYADQIFPLAASLLPGKILFGSDFPLLRQGPFLQRVRASGLGPEALEAILGGNAARLLGLQSAG
ncbi:MAG: amidohydrolase family protein [Chloroflexi bacterium]|nr:amidohydrolase family protein [Chloroflexota bacterium]